MKIVIVDNDSVVCGEIDLNDFDLTKNFAQSVIMDEILDIAKGHENE